MEIKEYTLEQLSEGISESTEMSIDLDMVDAFARLSGDVSPLHCDEEFAKSKGFEGRVVHGQLIAAGVSRLIGTKLPGKHGVLQSLEMGFRKPCYAPACLSIKGTVKSVSASVGQITIAVEVRDQQGTKIAQGIAKSMVRV